MTEAITKSLIDQLPAIIFAVAALISAITAMIAMFNNRTKIAENNAIHTAKLDDIGKKVDGGLTKLQEALAIIATKAVSSPTTTVITDRRNLSENKE